MYANFEKFWETEVRILHCITVTAVPQEKRDVCNRCIPFSDLRSRLCRVGA